jgi:putative ABC transport system permease protein
MSDHPRSSRFARLLARCYPRGLRAEYADDLARFIDDARRDPQYLGAAGRVAVALRLSADAVASLYMALRHRAPLPIRQLSPESSHTQLRSYSMNAFLQDMKIALRGFMRRPAFTLVAIATLTLGIGANSAIFTLVNGVLLKPLPYANAERLVLLWGGDGTRETSPVSVPDFEDIRTRNHTLQDVGIIRTQSVNLTGTDSPDRVVGAFTTAATLHALGAKPAIGRMFAPEETAIGHGQEVAVLNYATWQTRFGGRADIIGRTLILNGRPHVVIGVTSADFREPYVCDLWLPITSAPSVSWFERDNPQIEGVARIKGGYTLLEAQEDVAAVAAGMAAENGHTAQPKRFFVKDMHSELTGNSRFTLWILTGAVVAVLLIVVVNMANLQLVRASTRQREMSVRAALGANRSRLITQVLVESLILALTGGVLGLIAGQTAVKFLVDFMPMTVPSVTPIQLDARVVLFSLFVSVVTGLLFGLPAAFAGTRTNLQSALRSRTESAATNRLNLRNVLVVAELALCIVLLATAGLFTRSLLRLQQVPSGFNSENVMTAEFRLPAVKYDNDTSIVQFMTAALQQLRATRGVMSAALVSSVPLGGNTGAVSYVAQGQSEPERGRAPSVQYNAVSTDYFRTLQIPQLAGRDFTHDDNAASEPVVIVNKTFASKAWPGETALGKTVRLLGKPDVVARVIGIVGSVKQFTLTDEEKPQIYAAKFQNPAIFSSIVMRTSVDAEAMAPALRTAIWSVDRDQPVWKVRTLESLVDRDLATSRFSVGIISGFALLALVLAVIGVYGVMSFSVNQRTREVGIRMALGAKADEVQALMLRGGAEIILVAVVIGVGGALAAGRLLQSQLYNVAASDPVTMVTVPVTLALVALFACWVPARRASRVDPAITLRSE